MIAKLLAHGRDRAEAIARMRRALREFTIAGVRSSIPSHLHLLEQPDFVEGRAHVNWVDSTWRDRVGELVQAPPERVPVAAAIAALDEWLSGRRAAPRAQAGNGKSAWRDSGRRSLMERFP
jgi:acetyl-CoA carboxylase biotin carboxylase subunit